MKQQLLRGLCLLFVCLATAFASSTMLTSQVLPQSPIGVDIPGVGTKYFRTLNEAFSATKKANKDGCTIYIPSGSYPLSDVDSVRLNRRVNIFGSGAKGDGKTLVNGAIRLLQGADGSLIQGFTIRSGVSEIIKNYTTEDTSDLGLNRIRIQNCVITGDVRLFGRDNLVQNCIVYGCIMAGWTVYNPYREHRGSISISNSYFRNANYLSNASIDHCVVENFYGSNSGPDYLLTYADNVKVSNSIISFPNLLTYDHYSLYKNGSIDFSRNILLKLNVKENLHDAITRNGGKYYQEYNSLEGILENYKDGYRDENNFKLKSSVKSKFIVNGAEAGIYGGAGFDDKMMSPLPRIVITEAPVKTNADGKLILKVRIDQN